MFTLELCKLMKQAGCRFVSMGIETCSEEVLSKMVKGINKQDIEITLENMKQAQIWSHCFMINSFEGETDKNRWETFYYVRKNRRYFTSIGMGDFTLSRNAKIYSEIENNELEEISDFSNDLVYRSHSATSKEESLILQDYYSSINFTSEFFTQYIFEREHLALLISEQEGFSNHKWLLKEYMDKVQYNNKLYKVIQDHTSQAGWTPDTQKSLFVEIAPPEIEYPDFKQPTMSEDDYNIGDKITYNGKKYKAYILK